MRNKLLAVCLVILCASTLAHGWVMGIDFGAESYKVALVKPRFDVALNDASQRKTPSVVSYYKGDMLVGTDAKNTYTKAPKTTFNHLQHLLGRKWGNPLVEKYREEGYFLYPLVEEQYRGVFGIKQDEETIYTPEELVGLIFAQAKQIASKNAGLVIKDAVITVPEYFTQQERQSILDAAKLANVNVISLMNENTAVALNWGLERSFEETATNVIFYNMGHAATTVSLVSYKALPETKKNKTVGQLQVQNVAWDSDLGGRRFDARLVKHFLDVIQKKQKKDLSSDVRVIAKLTKEAQRVKEVLSANTEIGASVEGLTGDFDFKTDAKRETFENLCEDLFDRAILPIQQVLKDSGLSINDIHFFEIFGGGVRIPKLQQKIREFLNRDGDLDKHLNGDEAAVFGATYFGASQSAAFRAREFRVKDMSQFSTIVSVKSDTTDLDKNSELFKAGGRFNSKKTLTFSTDQNFTVSVSYDPDTSTAPLPEGTDLSIGVYDITGVPTTDRYNYTTKPKVSLSFRLNGNGIIVLDKAEAEITVIEYREEVVKEKKETTKEETEDKESKDNESQNETTNQEEQAQEGDNNSSENTEGDVSTEEESKKEVEQDGEEPVQESTESNDESETETTKKTIIKPVSRIHRVTLKIKPVSQFGMKSEDFSRSKKVLEEINKRTEEKREKESEKNSLESYIYEMKEKLDSSEDISKVTTSEQREKFLSELDAAGEWLYDEGSDATASEYKSKSDGLKSTGDKIMKRVKDLTARPAAIEYIRKSLETAKKMLENITQVKEVTEEERDEVMDLIEDAETWLSKKIKEQAELQPWDDAVLTSDQIEFQWKLVEYKLKPLAYRRAKKPPTPEKNTTIPADSGETETTEGDQEKTEGEEPSNEQDDSTTADQEGKESEHKHDEL